jgi:rhodanese-related sulfurtransferase
MTYKHIFRNSVGIVGLLFLSQLFSTCIAADQKPHAPETIDGVTIVSAEEVIEMILADPELLVIDSRKKTEFQKGHIQGAVNILNTRMKAEDLQHIAPDKDQRILFYCNGTRCLRSTDAITKAQSWGYTQIIWFRGGWKEWIEKRLPVVTGETDSLSAN